MYAQNFLKILLFFYDLIKVYVNKESIKYNFWQVISHVICSVGQSKCNKCGLSAQMSDYCSESQGWI